MIFNYFVKSYKSKKMETVLIKFKGTKNSMYDLARLYLTLSDDEKAEFHALPEDQQHTLLLISMRNRGRIKNGKLSLQSYIEETAKKQSQKTLQKEFQKEKGYGFSDEFKKRITIKKNEKGEFTTELRKKDKYAAE